MIESLFLGNGKDFKAKTHFLLTSYHLPGSDFDETLLIPFQSLKILLALV